MNKQPHIGQDVLYTLPASKEECAAKVVRIVNRQKNLVNLVLFTDNRDNTNIAHEVPYDEAGNTPNTWRFQEEQTRSAAGGR